jgi:hypothetical protein
MDLLTEELAARLSSLRGDLTVVINDYYGIPDDAEQAGTPEIGALGDLTGGAASQPRYRLSTLAQSQGCGTCGSGDALGTDR